MHPTFWSKLRREWKTAGLAFAAFLVQSWDLITSNALNWQPVVPEKYRDYFLLGLPIAMLALRKWTDARPDKPEDTDVG